MPESNELRAQLGKAQIQKLKALGTGLRVGKVMGRRVLVKLVVPFTQMDEVEKKGLLYIPEKVKDANTPLPSTGVVIKLGEGFNPENNIWPEPPLLHEGDMIMFSRFAGTDFRVDEEQLRILNEEEIMCTLEAVDEELAAKVAPVAE